MGFALTVIEILIASILIIGFVNEEKLANFENKVLLFIKRKIRKARRNRARVALRYVSRPAVVNSANKYCA